MEGKKKLQIQGRSNENNTEQVVITGRQNVNTYNFQTVFVRIR